VCIARPRRLSISQPQFTQRGHRKRKKTKKENQKEKKRKEKKRKELGVNGG
jgi:hypothetical protein